MNVTRYPPTNSSHYSSQQFQITLLGSEIFEDIFSLPGNRYNILWVQKGKGDICIDTNKYALQDETIFYIRPGQLTKLVVHEQVNGYLLSFDKQILDLYENRPTMVSHDLLHNHSLTSRISQIQKETSLFLENIAGKLMQEYNDDSEWRVEIISSLLKIFIIYLTRQNKVIDKEYEQCRKSEIASIFFSLIDTYFIDKKLVKDYADIMVVTPGYLNKVIKEITGFTASYHIQQRVVLEAKRCVLSGGNNLKEIAYTLGFCDPAHFSKFFKSSAGTNFTSFKRSALGYGQFV